MAIYRNSPLIGGISGSIGAMTFVNSSRGIVVRTRPLKKRFTTEASSIQTSKNALLRLRWSQLTDAQRLAWTSIAATITRTNRLGQSRTLSGFQLLIMHGMFLTATEITALDDPPQAIVSTTFPTPGLIFSQGGPYTVSVAVPPMPASTLVYTYGARPFQDFEPAFFNNFKLLGRDSFTPPTFLRNIQTIWEARLGALITDEIVAVRFRLRAPGLITGPQRTFTTTVL